MLGSSNRVAITVASTITTTQRWSGVCQVMSFALSLGVADGGARLLIGDQASDQDWVFNVPKTTDKGTFLAVLLDFAVSLCKSRPRHPLALNTGFPRPLSPPGSAVAAKDDVLACTVTQPVRQSVPCQLEFSQS